MPQHSMFPGDRRLDGIRLSIVDRTPDLLDRFDLVVQTRHDRGDWESLWAGAYDGVMSDLLPGDWSDLCGAFLFGEGASDILRSAVANHRVAGAHKRRHGDR